MSMKKMDDGQWLQPLSFNFLVMVNHPLDQDSWGFLWSATMVSYINNWKPLSKSKCCIVNWLTNTFVISYIIDISSFWGILLKGWSVQISPIFLILLQRGNFFKLRDDNRGPRGRSGNLGLNLNKKQQGDLPQQQSKKYQTFMNNPGQRSVMPCSLAHPSVMLKLPKGAQEGANKDFFIFTQIFSDKSQFFLFFQEKKSQIIKATV